MTTNRKRESEKTRKVDNEPTFKCRIGDTKYIRCLKEEIPQRKKKDFLFYANAIKRDFIKSQARYFVNEKGEKCFRIDNVNQ